MIFVLIFFSLPTFAQTHSLDEKLIDYINAFQISVPKTVTKDKPDLFEFGRKLFQDKNLSLSNNITCMTCHHPNLGTGDSLPFSIGTGGRGHGVGRFQNGAGLTPRNAPHLYNKGHSSLTTMFWDGITRFL